MTALFWVNFSFGTTSPLTKFVIGDHFGFVFCFAVNFLNHWKRKEKTLLHFCLDLTCTEYWTVSVPSGDPYQLDLRFVSVAIYPKDFKCLPPFGLINRWIWKRTFNKNFVTLVAFCLHFLLEGISLGYVLAIAT